MREGNVVEELELLANSVRGAIGESDSPSFIQARFQDGLRDIDSTADYFGLTDERREFMSFATVALFCSLLRVSWLVLGKGQ